MWYLWLIFALLAVLIPVGILFLAIKVEKLNSKDEQKTEINKSNAIKYMLFYWLCDLFFMSFIIDNLACKYIFGGLIMLIIFYNLSNIFTTSKGKSRNGLIKWGMVQDFIIGIGLSIYLIYIIPDTDLREIISVIIAAIYGGLLTLVGVAWTIRHSIIQKREDELAKAKPLFTFNFFTEGAPIVNNRKVCLVDDIQPTGNNEALTLPRGRESYMELENSAQSSFTITRFYFDGAWHTVTANNTMLPSSRLLVQLFRVDTVTHPVMEIEDIFERKFYYDLMFLFLPKSGIVTLGQLKEITEQEVVSRNIELGKNVKLKME